MPYEKQSGNVIAVTDFIRAELTSAHAYLSSLLRVKLNDSDHYRQLVSHLDQLAIALYQAQGARCSLLVADPSGATLALLPASRVTVQLAGATAYLTDLHTPKANQLSKYDGDRARVAHERLSELVWACMDGIAADARYVVTQAQEAGPTELLKMADAIAKTAGQKPVDLKGLFD